MTGLQLLTASVIMLLGIGIPLSNKVGENDDWSRLSLQDYIRFNAATTTLIGIILIAVALIALGR